MHQASKEALFYMRSKFCQKFKIKNGLDKCSSKCAKLELIGISLKNGPMRKAQLES